MPPFPSITQTRNIPSALPWDALLWNYLLRNSRGKLRENAAAERSSVERLAENSEFSVEERSAAEHCAEILLRNALGNAPVWNVLLPSALLRNALRKIPENRCCGTFCRGTLYGKFCCRTSCSGTLCQTFSCGTLCCRMLSYGMLCGKFK